MSCRFEWCLFTNSGHDEHVRDDYVPASQSAGRGRQVGAGILVEDSDGAARPLIYVHIQDAVRADEDAHLTLREADELSRNLRSAVSIARTVTAGRTDSPGFRPRNEVTETPPDVDDVGARLGPDGGDITRLAHFRSGQAETLVERYDYKDTGGEVSSTFEVVANWASDGCGIADFQLARDNWDQLEHMIAVLSAASAFVWDEIAADADDLAVTR